MNAFTCPRCGVLAPQELYQLNYGIFLHSDKTLIANKLDIELFRLSLKKEHEQNRLSERKSGNSFRNSIKDWELHLTICTHCEKYTVWENQNIIFPLHTSLPDPEKDMPENVKAVYNEAALVFKHSPRSAAALIRLAIETLIPQLPDFKITKRNLVDMIGELVKQGIPYHIQQALDGIRLYGNKGIHTAEIISEDDSEVSFFLFSLINRIVRELISDKKAIDEFYHSFPVSKLEAIKQRDEKIIKERME